VENNKQYHPWHPISGLRPKPGISKTQSNWSTDRDIRSTHRSNGKPFKACCLHVFWTAISKMCAYRFIGDSVMWLSMLPKAFDNLMLWKGPPDDNPYHSKTIIHLMRIKLNKNVTFRWNECHSWIHKLLQQHYKSNLHNLHTFLLVCAPLPEPCAEPDASFTRTVFGRRTCVLPLDPELDVLGICFSNDELPWRREITRVWVLLFCRLSAIWRCTCLKQYKVDSLYILKINSSHLKCQDLPT
jgi:hypothetical protein